jgi:hypothetical protein
LQRAQGELIIAAKCCSRAAHRSLFVSYGKELFMSGGESLFVLRREAPIAGPAILDGLGDDGAQVEVWRGDRVDAVLHGAVGRA